MNLEKKKKLLAQSVKGTKAISPQLMLEVRVTITFFRQNPTYHHSNSIAALAMALHEVSMV